VSLIHASNVTGGIVDVATLTEYAHTVGAFVIIDAAQTVGHMNVSFDKLNADALFFSGHKMCGPTGVGVLALKKGWIDIFVPPYGGGGTVYSVTNEKTVFVDGAKKFEAGTPPIAEVIGLGVAIDYINNYEIKDIHEHVQKIIIYAQDILKDISGVRVYAAQNNIGVISLVIDSVHPHDVAHILAEEGIAVRAGFQCAELISRKISENGVARISVYGYTSHEDIDALAVALQKVKNTFHII
jgi:cysteine desulfurase / selenocysteine lyase